ncbi:DgyrCDS7509 [Dimorphilus gyrociliatus]|uniref:Adenylyltransferase and sulfurtransferase MOCS3 homolog n=1 Tax=Dimorphilus gyrociliatus TaxID=2664684 RepID=A0A7I8VTT4_9ANNE|nr:DgyrCDS7509 [Dimorphilus gyrociliatus]
MNSHEKLSYINEIEKLKKELKDKNDLINQLNNSLNGDEKLPKVQSLDYSLNKEAISNLNNENILRYSRQLILPEIGVKGQLRLSNTSVLIVGAGGLGCPSAIYLAAAGIGTIGVVDYDEIELSNLHRQILHTESRTGLKKSASVAASCSNLNSSVKCIPYHTVLSSKNALELINQYDIIVDATDNVATRYLLNDAAVLCQKPLVSGSALKFEGQLTVYNYQNGPCFRCLFPKPPPPETVTNCSDGGVLGVVPGIIGSLQALEVIKIAIGLPDTFKQRLLLFDGLAGSFRNIGLRPRQKNCAVCGDDPSIKELIDYEQFCGAKADDKGKNLTILEQSQRISAKEFSEILKSKEKHLLIDVRSPVELEICDLGECLNIPIGSIEKEDQLKCIENTIKDNNINKVFVVCRKGNDSQIAVKFFQEKLTSLGICFQDIRGGLYAWQKSVDQSLPLY